MKKIIIITGIVILSAFSTYLVYSKKNIGTGENIETSETAKIAISAIMTKSGTGMEGISEFTNNIQDISDAGYQVNEMDLETRDKKESIPSGEITDINFQRAILENLRKNDWSKVSLSDLKNMRSLKATEKGIRDISGIGKLINLEEIYLDRNEISTIPSEIGNLIDLDSLYLLNNEIESVPAELGKLDRLTILELTFNNIGSLPVEISGMSNLQKLHLGYNNLQGIPDTIGSLTNLTYIDLDSNQLITLPAEIGMLEELESLYISYNKITSLPQEIANLERIDGLSLSENLITCDEVTLAGNVECRD